MKRAIAALALASLVVACGARGARPRHAGAHEPPADPLAYLPPDSSVIARVALAPWRDTPLWSVAQSISDQGVWGGDLIDLQLLDEVVVGGAPERTVEGKQEAEPAFVMVLKGRFGANYLAPRMAARKATPDVQGPLTFYALGTSFVTQVSNELLVACSPVARDGVVSRYGGASEGELRKGRLFETLAAKVGYERADLVVLAEDAHQRGLGGLVQNSEALGLTDIAEQAGRIALSVDLGSQVLLTAASETKDGPAATRLKQSIEGALRSLETNLFVGLLGLRPVVSALKVSLEENMVIVRGAVPESDMRALLKRAANMLEIAMAQEQGQARLPVLAP